MCRPITGFCAVLVWKQVYTLPILVWNRVWFSRKLRVCMNVFIHRISSEWIRKKEKCASLKWILRNLFCWRSNLKRLATSQPHEFLSENGYRFQRPGLKTSVEIDIIWSEIGSWFEGLGSTPHPHKNSQEYPSSLHLFINTMYCSNYSRKLESPYLCSLFCLINLWLSLSDEEISEY